MAGQTIAVLLGAHEFGGVFDAHLAFSTSATRFEKYLRSAAGLHLADDDILPLFDSLENGPGQLLRIVNFLVERAGRAERLLVYYVGHGWHPASGEYHLAIQKTHRDIPLTSLPFAALAEVLRRHAKTMQTYLVLDACYSGKAAKYFQSRPTDAVKEQVEAEFKHQPTGVSLLCSSSSSRASYIHPDGIATAFTLALDRVLERGVGGGVERLSLTQLSALIWDELKQIAHEISDRYPEFHPAKPETHSPRQPDIDLATLPFFPNSAAYDPAARERAETEERRRREADEERRVAAEAAAVAAEQAAAAVALAKAAEEAKTREILRLRKLADDRRVALIVAEVTEKRPHGWNGELITAWLDIRIIAYSRVARERQEAYGRAKGDASVAEQSKAQAWENILSKGQQAISLDYHCSNRLDNEYRIARRKAYRATAEYVVAMEVSNTLGALATRRPDEITRQVLAGQAKSARPFQILFEEFVTKQETAARNRLASLYRWELSAWVTGVLLGLAALVGLLAWCRGAFQWSVALCFGDGAEYSATSHLWYAETGGLAYAILGAITLGTAFIGLGDKGEREGVSPAEWVIRFGFAAVGFTLLATACLLAWAWVANWNVTQPDAYLSSGVFWYVTRVNPFIIGILGLIAFTAIWEPLRAAYEVAMYWMPTPPKP